jgi:hypothetical protein
MTRLAQLATSTRLPFERRAGFVQRAAAALAAGETSLLNAIAVAQRNLARPGGRSSPERQAGRQEAATGGIPSGSIGGGKVEPQPRPEPS